MKKIIFYICCTFFLVSCSANTNTSVESEYTLHLDQGICNTDLGNLENTLKGKKNLHIVYNGGCADILQNVIQKFGEKLWKLDSNIEYLREVLFAIDEYKGNFQGDESLAMEILTDSAYTLSSEEVIEIISYPIEPFFGKGMSVTTKDDKNKLCEVSFLGCLELSVIDVSEAIELELYTSGEELSVNQFIGKYELIEATLDYKTYKVGFNQWKTLFLGATDYRIVFENTVDENQEYTGMISIYNSEDELLGEVENKTSICFDMCEIEIAFPYVRVYNDGELVIYTPNGYRDNPYYLYSVNSNELLLVQEFVQKEFPDMENIISLDRIGETNYRLFGETGAYNALGRKYNLEIDFSANKITEF